MERERAYRLATDRRREELDELAYKSSQEANARMREWYGSEISSVRKKFEFDIKTVKEQGEKLKATQRVGYAAAGIDIKQGSPVELFEDTDKQVAREVKQLSLARDIELARLEFKQKEVDFQDALNRQKRAINEAQSEEDVTLLRQQYTDLEKAQEKEKELFEKEIEHRQTEYEHMVAENVEITRANIETRMREAYLLRKRGDAARFAGTIGAASSLLRGVGRYAAYQGTGNIGLLT